MKSSRCSPVAAVGLSILALLASGARPLERTQTSPFPEGGSVEIRLESAQAPGATQERTLSLEYGRVDPLNPALLPVIKRLEPAQSLPVMIRNQGRLLTLQTIRVYSSDGASVLTLNRRELDPLRRRARAGGAILLQETAQRSELTARVELPAREEYELPARLTGPGLSFSESDLLDLMRLDDLDDSLLRIRAVSFASETFLNELIDLVQKTPSIDASRLQLLLDGTPFPAMQLAALKQRLRELPDTAENGELRRVLADNLALAERLAPLGNRLFMLGLLKIKSLGYPEAESLLGRLHVGSDSNELAFLQAFERLGGSYEALKPEQKLTLFALAARKNAPEFAAPLGRDWFLKDSDKTMSALLDLVRQLPAGAARDTLSRLAAAATGPISAAEFAALTAPIRSEAIVRELYDFVTPRIAGLTAAQLLTLLTQRPSGDFRDSLLLLSARHVSGFDADGIRNLLLACSGWPCRDSLVRSVFAKITGSAAAVLGEVFQVLPSEPGRDELAFLVAELSLALDLRDLGSLFAAMISEQTAVRLFDLAETKLTPPAVAEAGVFCDGLYKPGFALEVFRDRVLLASAQTAPDLTAKNLEQLLTRASNDVVREKIRQIAEQRLQKP